MKPVITKTSDGRWIFYCPGCKCSHFFLTEGDGPKWQWNGDVVKPTVTPSIKVTLGCWPGEPQGRVCHFHLVADRIEYCNDCHHHLNGMKVDMEPDE